MLYLSWIDIKNIFLIGEKLREQKLKNIFSLTFNILDFNIVQKKIIFLFQINNLYQFQY